MNNELQLLKANMQLGVEALNTIEACDEIISKDKADENVLITKDISIRTFREVLAAITTYAIHKNNAVSLGNIIVNKEGKITAQ